MLDMKRLWVWRFGGRIADGIGRGSLRAWVWEPWLGTNEENLELLKGIWGNQSPCG